MTGLHHLVFTKRDEVRAAIDELARRNDVDKERFGFVGLQPGRLCGRCAKQRAISGYAR